MSTKQKSPFFDGGWSQISRWDRNFRKKFLDFLCYHSDWHLLPKFAAILATKGGT
jgi:hypothetical protein